MSHFAKIENGIVITVNVATQEWVDTQSDKEKWVQTSYNTHGGKHYDENGIEDDKPQLRFNYACIGYTYDEVRDAFIPPKLYDSWALNEETCLWEAPIPYPSDEKYYYWNEEELNWMAIE